MDSGKEDININLFVIVNYRKSVFCGDYESGLLFR